jgi:hypothetical protein
VVKIIIGVAFVAAVATIGDYAWFQLGARNVATAGSIHGALLLGSVGLVLGWLSGRVLAGLAAGVAAGVGGALAYYAMAAVMGGRGMNLQAVVAAWAAVWVVLAISDGRLLRRPQASWAESLVRGLAAAIFGGLAFYFMVDQLWGKDPREGNALLRFVDWLVAWAPGIFAITSTFERRTST